MATIVVVEDQPDNLKLIRALLTRLGHRVVGLASGEPLVATLAAEQPAPALVLLDIQLPGRDGYRVLADVKQMAGEHPWKVVPPACLIKWDFVIHVQVLGESAPEARAPIGIFPR